MKKDFSGRVVMATGASRGIGREIARRFADSGARVVVHFHKNSQAAEQTLADLNGRFRALRITRRCHPCAKPPESCGAPRRSRRSRVVPGGRRHGLSHRQYHRRQRCLLSAELRALTLNMTPDRTSRN